MIRKSIPGVTLLAVMLLLPASRSSAQALPRINALYPPGARVGSTLDVAIRAAGLEGARDVVVEGSGLSVKLNDAGVKIDPADQKVFSAKCALCHALRGPGTVSRTADQWVATVDRMIKEKGAPIEAADRTRIVSYLQAAARQSAGLTARVTIAPDAVLGERRIRVVGMNGTTTVFPFEVTNESEVLDTEPNDEIAKPQHVALPVVISGELSKSGDVDCYSFEAKKGERLVFDCNAYRLNPGSQASFFPVLYLYDSKARELAKNTGYNSLDPLLDWTAPEDGTYVVMIRDMLYRGAPTSIYRLRVGQIPYDTYLYPAGGRSGAPTTVSLGGENMGSEKVTIPASETPGLRLVTTPHGTFPFVTGSYPEFLKPSGPEAVPVSLPASLNGRIERTGAVDRFTFSVAKEALGPYTFEVFAAQIGSRLAARLTLRGAQGQSLATGAGAPANADPRIDYTFSKAGEYSLEIADVNDRSGSSYVYRISAGPAAPDFELTMGPDNPNLGPGASVYLAARVLRREGVTGDIAVTFAGLPPGVTASPTVIHPGENQAFVVLTAAPDAKPGSYSISRAFATADVDGHTIRREITPYEIYKIGNNDLTAYRSQFVVTVAPESGWRISLTASSTELTSGSEPIQVTAHLTRNGLEGDIPFAIIGLPDGVQARRAIQFRKGESSLTFTLNASRKNGSQRQAGSSQFLLAAVNGREGEAMQMCSPALVLTVRSESR